MTRGSSLLGMPEPPGARSLAPCPSRKSYPHVAMMQFGQDLCGDDGPRSLRRVVAARPCSTPSACASHCSRANTKLGPVVNAIRRGSGHDPSSRAKVSRSDVQYTGSARATSVRSGGWICWRAPRERTPLPPRIRSLWHRDPRARRNRFAPHTTKAIRAGFRRVPN